jgi:erythromycin esterase-like protein
VSSHVAVPSFPGSVEDVLHSTGIPQLVLDLRRASPDVPGSTWLLGSALYRDIGAIAADGFAFTSRLTTDFDALVFFDRTTPTVLLPFN